MNKKRLIIGVLLSALFLWLFLRNLDLRQVWAVIKAGNPYWIVIAIVFNLFNYFMRSLRWRYFLLPIKKVSIWNSYNTTVIGFALSSVFPARIGEVVRPYLLGVKENIGRSAALATVVVERLFDTLTVLLMLVFYLLFLIHPDELSAGARASLDDLKRAGLYVFAFAIAISLFLYYLKRNPTLIRKIVGWFARILPKKIRHSIDGILDSFIEGLSILHDPVILLKITYWSILFWLVIAISFWAGVKAYLMSFPFTGTFLIMILLAIGIAVPTPGGVGSYHLACKIGLTRFFDVPDAQAGAIALVSHAIGFIPITIQGMLHLWHEGLSTKRLSRIAEESQEEQQTLQQPEQS